MPDITSIPAPASPFTTDNPSAQQQEGVAAVVTSGPVSATDNGAVYDDAVMTPSSAVWRDYRCINRFERDQHTYMMGVTSPDGFEGATAAFVQLAMPTLLWVADWSVLRMQLSPLIPDPDIQDPNYVFLGCLHQPAMIQVTGDGETPLYRISGTYMYGCLNPSANPTEDPVYPLAPWLLEAGFVRTIPDDTLTQGIINATTQSNTLTGVPE